MACRLQVFKNDVKARHSGWMYRFAIVDFNRSNSYPANFVCMLPTKVYRCKSNRGSAFEALFGDKGPDLAIRLLSNALRTEQDADVKTEIAKRLKLLQPKEVTSVKCSQCTKSFQPRKIRKYKQYLCTECLAARYSPKTH